MQKQITAIIILTILSALSIPTTATICGIKNIPNEVLSFPHNLTSLGLFANLILTSGFTGLILGLLGNVLYFNSLKQAYLAGIFLLTLFLTAVEVFCLSKFGLAISPPMSAIIADTNNVAEITGFFQTYFDITTVLIMFGLCLLAWLIWHYSESIYKFVRKYKKGFVVVLALFVIIALAGVKKVGGLTASPPFMKMIYNIKYLFKVRYSIAQMSADKTNRVELIADHSDTPYIIFIIGESESRHFMGIYNNRYDSTPYAQKQVDSGNMFVFTDTISMKSSTAQVMTPLLSFMENTTETLDVSKFDPIIDVFKKADYQTFWLSNHEKLTKDLSYATYMSTRCDYSIFTSKTTGNAENMSALSLKDEVMLPPLDDYINNQAVQKDKNLFVMQIMGSHIRYIDRCPDNFKRFQVSDIKENGFSSKQKETLAEYLNTIYYTDHILNEIISRVKDKDAILVYISDHGEEMWQSGFVGHGPTNISKYMVEIPMLIWVSDIYKTKRPANLNRIENALNKPFMTDNLVHVLLDLAGIETKQYDPSKSVVNEAYLIRERLINGIRYEDLRE